MTSKLEYAFDNRAREAASQLACIEQYLDPITVRRLAGLVRSGDRVWEVGAGGGSVARMLARAVGPQGLVLATDLDPTQLVRREGLTVRVHDVRRDPIPEEAPFHLIHARLVLLHLPERRQVLRRLAGALAPGGWLVLEEFDCSGRPQPLAVPEPAAGELFVGVVDAMMGVLEQRGADLSWAHEVYGEMADIGLIDLNTVQHVEGWSGGSTGARLYEVNSNQLQPQLLAGGFEMAQLQLFRGLMRDPTFAAMSYPVISTRGRKIGAREPALV